MAVKLLTAHLKETVNPDLAYSPPDCRSSTITTVVWSLPNSTSLVAIS